MLHTLHFEPSTSTIKSVSTAGTPVNIEITNHTAGTLKLFWIDSSGNTKDYGDVDPGETQRQGTNSAHAWELRKADGTVVTKFMASYAGEITVSAANELTFEDHTERVIRTPDGDWSTAQGYGMVNYAASLGIADTAPALPMSGQTNNLALNLVGAPSAWAAGYTGKGVKIAVIDSGIAQHTEISGRIVGGYDFYDGDTDPTPADGRYEDHGLSIAGALVGSHAAHGGPDTMGVAPDATLLNIRVGSTAGGPTSAIVQGIRYAVDQGAKVISLSMGNDRAKADPGFAEAVHYAFEHNVVLVNSGGNDLAYGPLGHGLTGAATGEMLLVGNYDLISGSPFTSSNQPGTAPFPWVMAGSSGYLPNSDGGYSSHDDGGTSYATPYVSGLAALLFQQNPNATATEIIDKIIAGASIGANAATGATAAPLTGSAAADRFRSTEVNDSFDGGAGVDSVAYAGKHGDYTITRNGNGWIVTDDTGADGSDLLANVERLTFADSHVALDIDGTAGQVYRLYQAAFNRVPDLPGLGAWIESMDRGLNLEGVANGFLHSPEFAQRYGAQPTNAALVNGMYQNVLHRAPDAGGQAHWMNLLETHTIDAAGLLIGFSESAENKAALIGVIGAGIEYTPVA
ncbi:von Hippel-Lindau disease tumor suppressor protein [Pseudoduganella flava]|uniref:S8 family serine peptidase n=1 Tax=Pseudoduganella flava TaxID=871742 RepID=A0A562PVN2_9BURK|nr:S8 family serine peptidase [Pseudoduganella flava]QGZ39623.1 S8 family serine peptidase [Pseudoduganella flava]TWI48522.1 von Hippel-Lindau disease tumor suppressor protein [Pseudoduganella flava]